MGHIYNDFSELVGNTPLVALNKLQKSNDLAKPILAKLEYLNPAGSIKDRTAWGIIRDAERNGHIKAGDLLVDLTSGNTGIGIAAVAAARGYRTKFYLRDTISEDKLNILRQFGSQIVLINNDDLLKPGAIKAVLERIHAENPDAYYTGQRSNQANPAIHFETTGPEIWRDTDGKIDILVGTIGTGGTIAGVGRHLKQHNPDLKIIVVEPGTDSIPTLDNPLAETIEGVHKVTEVDETTLPENYDKSVIDEFITISTDDARRAALAVAREEGFLVGTSSGAAISASLVVAKRPENHGKTIVTIFPDSGERYLSLFATPVIV